MPLELISGAQDILQGRVGFFVEGAGDAWDATDVPRQPRFRSQGKGLASLQSGRFFRNPGISSEATVESDGTLSFQTRLHGIQAHLRQFENLAP